VILNVRQEKKTGTGKKRFLFFFFSLFQTRIQNKKWTSPMDLRKEETQSE